MSEKDKLTIRGARVHNLKDVSLSLPKNKLIVFTGLSGSGKSSLAFDTIYAEGQRKYVESLSSYARQFLGIMDKADVDSIEGLSPAIAIDQKSTGSNPRSTVGTITEIYDYLRLLFARAGHPHSPKTGKRLVSQTVQQIVDKILQLHEKAEGDTIKIQILAPLVKNRKGTYEDLFRRLQSQGYLRVRVDEMPYSLDEEINLERYQKHNIELIVDRLVIDSKKTKDQEFTKRVTDSIELALSIGEQELYINLLDQKKDIFFSEKLVDPETGESFPNIEPHSFSFNSPYGACRNCNGLGSINEIDPILIYNPNLSISEGGLFPWSRMADNMNSWNMRVLQSVADSHDFSLRESIGSLSEDSLNVVLYGTKNEKYKIKYSRGGSSEENIYHQKYEGVIPSLERRYKQTESDYIRKEIEQYMREKICPYCEGARLNENSLSVTVEEKNIHNVSNLPLVNFHEWLDLLKIENSITNKDSLSKQEKIIIKQVVKEIESRINFLNAVGLDYLSLNRTAKTLSGGEAQRIRLASQIGTGLSGVLYVLDEPSIGLHQRDNARLIDTLQNLRDLGNTIIVVEHDEDTMLSADYLVDIGPGAGEHGGEIVAIGKPDEVIKNPESLTGQYLSGKKEINLNEIKKEVTSIISEQKSQKIINPEDKYLEITGAKQHNLKDVSLKIPIGQFVSITGVSGSGKSTLVLETLVKVVKQRLYGSKNNPGEYKELNGVEHIDKLINIDQSPIGRTPRSNPATYTGVFTNIRSLFADTREAKIRGYLPGRFSFNVKGGRCETCSGDGVLKIEMQFLPDVYVECDVCEGARYNRDTLQIDFKGKSISEVLDMSVEEALNFFENQPSIKNKLITLKQVGLEYLKLGQSAPTLSGGEAQRVKLASELSKRSTGKTLYVLDEPTTGLHFDDLRKLLVVLHTLVEKGNTVLVIEHNLDLIKTADWVIDLGPEGGDGGGEIIAEGTPKQIAAIKESYTGQWLIKHNIH